MQGSNYPKANRSPLKKPRGGRGGGCSGNNGSGGSGNGGARGNSGNNNSGVGPSNFNGVPQHLGPNAVLCELCTYAKKRP